MGNFDVKYHLFLPPFDTEWKVNRFFCIYDNPKEIFFDCFETKETYFKILLINRVLGDVNSVIISSGLMDKNDSVFTDFIKPIFDDFGLINKLDIIYDFYD